MFRAEGAFTGKPEIRMHKRLLETRHIAFFVLFELLELFNMNNLCQQKFANAWFE